MRRAGPRLAPAAAERALTNAIDALTILNLEIVAAQAMLGLEMANHQLDGGAVFNDAARLAGDAETVALIIE
jgi:hypothetical protein